MIDAVARILRDYGLSFEICGSHRNPENLPPISGIVVDLQIVPGYEREFHIMKSDPSWRVDYGSPHAWSLLNNNPDLPMLAITNHEINDREQRFLNHRNHVFLCSFNNLTSIINQFVDAIFRHALAFPFGFGAVIFTNGVARDGQIIRLIQPAYFALVKALSANPDLIAQIGPREWEEIIAGSYERAGFDEVILTPRSGDLGRDIIAIKHGFGSIKFIEQVKAYKVGHIVKADEVRALLGVLHAEQSASKAIFTTTSHFAPRLQADRLISPYLPHRLELVDRERLLMRLAETLHQTDERPADQ